MDRTGLRQAAQRICGNPWFWRGLCLAALVAAVGYLKVTLLAPLGGDDQVNNLDQYYLLSTTSPWKVFLEQLQGIWDALCLQNSRFFPFSTLPTPIRYWFKGDIDRYRLYIIGHTLVDAAVMGLLVKKATGNKRLGLALFAVLPLMLCLWSDHTINGMYSYAALPQMALLPALLAGLCMVTLHKTGHWCWAVLGAFLTFYTCGTYEIGYVYIFMLGVLALLLEKRFWNAVRLGLPFLGGELVALFYYVMSARLNAAGGGYEGVEAAADSAKFLEILRWQISGAFPLNPLWFAKVQYQNLLPGDVVWPLVLAVICVFCLVAAKPSLKIRQAVCLLGMGIVMLAGPAVLVAVSQKYQNIGWINEEAAYIPATVESFGVALLVLTILVLLFQWVRARSRWGVVLLAILTVAGLTACGAYQHACTRERYDNGRRDTYEMLADSVEAGLVQDVPELSPLVCEFNVWGGSQSAQQAFFLRYGDCVRNAYHVDEWEADPQPNGEPIYFLCYAREYEGYDVVWLAHVIDDMTRYADSVKVYVQGDKVPADATLRYVTEEADGSENTHEVSIQKLPQSQPDENGDYFVTLEDENIVSRQISLWPHGLSAAT